MARQKKLNWPTRVYKYAVIACDVPPRMKTSEGLPTHELWSTALRMQDLWCSLAREHEAARNEVQTYAAAAVLTPEVRVEIWERFNATADKLCKEAPLNWECAPEVRQRFDACCVRAARNKDGGWPKVRGLRTISVPHRFTGGGASLVKLLSPRSSRVFLETLSVGVVHGRFGLEHDTTINFSIVLHRPVPADAIVKSVRWCGRRNLFGWTWSLVITVQEPPPPERQLTGKTVAIDVGWRKRGDSHIRVAYALDSDGKQWEMLLPLDFSTSSIRRHNQRTPDKPMPTCHADLWKLQEQMSAALNAAKAAAAELLQPTLPPGWAQLGRQGLLKLRDTTTDSKLHSILAAWASNDLAILSRYVAASERMVRRRTWLYQNWALQLAKAYDEILFEKSVGVSRVVSQPKRDRKEGNTVNLVQAASLRYHQIAATSELAVAIKNAAGKTGTVLRALPAEGTTGICNECGGMVRTGPNLLLVCENGHQYDQDENAVKNLYMQIESPKLWALRLRKYKKVKERERQETAGVSEE